MTDKTQQRCGECGASLGNNAHAPIHDGKRLCIECYIKALDPEGLMAKSGQLCQRCGASLDQTGKALTDAGQLICLNCAGNDQAAGWDKRKLPDVPEKCERCGTSLVGSDVAMLWLGQAICGKCFKEVRQAHPEVTEFGLIPLVDLSWTGMSGGSCPDLLLNVMPIGAAAPVDPEDAGDWVPNSIKHIN